MPSAKTKQDSILEPHEYSGGGETEAAGVEYEPGT